MDYSQIKGTLYFPSYARNMVECWHNYDPRVIDRELGLAEELGLNSVRVFLHHKIYRFKSQLMTDNFENLLTLCEKHNIKALPVLFDSCGESPVSLHWISNPGNNKLMKRHWASYEKYVKDIVASHEDDSRILLWEIMSEPKGAPLNVLSDFVNHFISYVRELTKTPLTVGSGIFDPLLDIEGVSPDDIDVDVTSVHVYEYPKENWLKPLEKIGAYEKRSKKPVIIEEWGSWNIPPNKYLKTDEDQLKFYKEIAPIVMNSGYGWYLTVLMRSQQEYEYALTGIFRPDGSERPAVSIVRKELARTKNR